MNSSHSSNEVVSPGLPQHLIDSSQSPRDDEDMTTMPAPSSSRRRQALSSGLALVACCALLAAAPTSSYALSLSSTSTRVVSSTNANNVRSLVDQARMIRELKNGSAESERAKQRLSTSMDISSKPLLDKNALSAALFDDGFNNSLESAIVANNLKKKNQNKNNGTVKKSAKSRAEEFDRFMEEDASVASIVQENIKPGSLVDEVQQSKGAEALLQQEAADRRRSREANVASSSSTRPLSIEVTRKTKLASSTTKSKPSSSTTTTTTKKSSSPLLTREQEYALAHTIQAGTRVHKLRSEYETSHSQPLTKRQWAQLANMSGPNELRKLISEYRTAKQELVSSNMGLVRAVVKSYARKAKFRGVPEDELIQEGTLGLIRAAELFDPAKGLRFSTYATIWIKGVLSNANSLDDVITLPNRERVLWNKVHAAWEEMALEAGTSGISGKGGRPSVSSAKELAKRLGMKQSLVEIHLRRMACVSNVLSLDYQYSSTTRSGYATGNQQDGLMASAQFGTDADLADRAQFKADLVAGLVRNLNEKELTLMRLRYGLEDGNEYTIKECASMMGINRETARLLQHACLKKLREASNMESLQEYLLTVA